MTLATFMSRSKSFSPACDGDPCSVIDLISGPGVERRAADGRLDRAGAVDDVGLEAVAGRDARLGDFRRLDRAVDRRPSADPLSDTVPKSTARLLTDAPSAEGLIWNVALPGFPAAFETPGIGLSMPAGVRSTSTSAEARDSGALSLIGSGPVSQPKLIPRLTRAAWSSVAVRTAEPSSPGAREASR